MTEIEARTLHRELWQWLIDNPWNEKQDWPKWSAKGIQHDCFACVLWYDLTQKPPKEYNYAIADEKISCPHCKLNNIAKSFGRYRYRKAINEGWGDAFCLMGIYSAWIKANTYKKRIKYATIIRDLWPDPTENPEAPQ